MKKQILISSIIAAGILGGTGLIAINNRASAEETVTNTTIDTPIAANTNLVVSKPISTTKNETVYVITDEAGNAKTRFIGSSIYDGTESLPFSFSVTYYLNSQEINGQDLKGKSGHIKIVYHYNSTATYQNKYIPFIAITGLSLDHSKFSNVKLTNGKIINETSDSYIIAGYSFTGMNQNLGTDFLPETFILEADTTDFSLKNTYTIFENSILADLDTSKLSRLDELTSSVYQLEDGINKLVQGATDLSNGLATALNGTKELYNGSKTLANGAKELSDGLNLIVSNNEQIQYGANTVIGTILNTANEALDILHTLGVATEYDEITIANYQDFFNDLSDLISTYQVVVATYIENLNIPNEQKATIGQAFETAISTLETANTSIKNLIDLNAGVIAYTDAVATAAAGAKALSTGANTLSAGLGSLVEGETKLYEGSVTLKDGLTTFKTVGIDKLVNFASKDLASFTRNARATVTAAGSYKSFGNIDANSVKFIVKTPSI